MAVGQTRWTVAPRESSTISCGAYEEVSIPKRPRTGIWGVAVPSVLGAAETFLRVDPFGGLSLTVK
jgi:hypothetical protein